MEINLTKNNNIFDNIFDKEYFYMHDSNAVEVEIGNNWSWHRDNPCRRTGFGPDWEKSSPYDAFTVIIYLLIAQQHLILMLFLNLISLLLKII